MTRDSTRARSTHIRLDVQGLRAVAVGVVLLYHAGVPFLPGGYVGVDVFFVISGFLITGLLIRELEQSGRISLGDFWARRARRILPAAAAALALTAVLTLVIFPMTRWQWTGTEIAASAMYVVNWLFAVKSTDYLAGDDSASPVQHFWSLAVEEQFYIVWPTILVIAVFVVMRLHGRLRARTLVGILAATLLVASLTWSIADTAASPSEAYFSTITRLWELAVGALLAAVVPALRRAHAGWASMGTWTGLVAIGAAAFLYNGSTPFPGIAAALPVVGAALVVGLGEAAGSRGAVAFLAARPMTWIGDRSYSLYLFHWPLIVFAFALIGETSVWLGLVAAALAFLPAALSYTWIERPILTRAKNWRRPIRTSLLAGAAFTAVGVLVGASVVGVVKISAPKAPNAVAMLQEGVPFGAMSSASATSDELLLGPVAAAEDFNSSCPSTATTATKVVECSFGAPDPATKVLVIGDSKMRQWVGALRILADENRWGVTAILKDSCPYISGNVSRNGSIFSECARWNTSVRERVQAERFDMVITSSNLREGVRADGAPLSDSTTEESIRSVATGLDGAWREFTDSGVPVVVLSDTPSMGGDVPDCVASPFHAAEDCAVSTETALTARGDSQRMAAEGNPLVTFIDVSSWLCSDGVTCPAVIGRVVAYSDTSHITNTYAISLVPELRKVIRP